MTKKLVLVNKPIHPAAFERLEKEANVLAPYGASADRVLTLLPQAQALILGIGLTMGPAELDLAENLEVIGRHGVGLDNVDIIAASERGIPVTFTPYGPTESTAEHALLLILATARRLAQLDRAVRAGQFSIRLQPEAMGYELEGKRLGIVGFGRIGRRLAEMCREALHMSVFVFDPYVDPQTVIGWGATYSQDLLDLARSVDVLSIHTPLSPATHHLIDREVIHAMKPGAILVNTSRGPVVDETALIEALQDGHLGGAGLDVYDPQPPAADSPLLQFDEVVLTPHVASFTHEGRRRMGLTVVEDVLRVLRGEHPQYLANPEAWSRRRAPGTQPGSGVAARDPSTRSSGGG
jgi:D-3-phosphoglycerate dehydrogenase